MAGRIAEDVGINRLTLSARYEPRGMSHELIRFSGLHGAGFGNTAKANHIRLVRLWLPHGFA